MLETIFKEMRMGQGELDRFMRNGTPEREYFGFSFPERFVSRPFLGGKK